MLDQASIQSSLGSRTYGRSLEVKVRTGSTNDDVREAAQLGLPSGHVVVADAQDRGRGAHGRTWSSPGGTDLYFSILERRALDGARLPWLTLAVGLGLRDAVAAHVDTPVRIKWPNDLLIGDQKCAGILVESSSTGTQVGPFVIGVGLDVNRSVFPPDLQGIATSMYVASRRTFDRDRLLSGILASIEERVEALHAGDVAALREDLDHHLAWVGQRVSIDAIEGVIEHIEADGALVLATATGRRSLRSGTLRRA